MAAVAANYPPAPFGYKFLIKSVFVTKRVECVIVKIRHNYVRVLLWQTPIRKSPNKSSKSRQSDRQTDVALVGVEL